MATLREVHAKIQEFGKTQGDILIQDIVLAFDSEDDIAIHIESLSTLEFLEVNFEKSVVSLTTSGRYANII